MNLVATPSRGIADGAPLQIVGYRDVIVHLDGTTEDEFRLAHAEAIAARFKAHLTGLYTNPLPDIGLYAGEFGGTVIGEISDAARRQGDAVQARLRRRFARLDVGNELRRLENIPVLLDGEVANEARWADLFVASPPYGAAELQRWGATIERVMMDGAHAVYFVPQGIKQRRDLRTVVVGWVNTREAARAVAEAMPLLATAKTVHLVSVREPGRGRMGGAEAMADIAAHLDRHGIDTTISVLPDTAAPAAVLLAEAHRISADLIVAGAYGHTRLREWIFGGTTYDLLRGSDLPILMAH